MSFNMNLFHNDRWSIGFSNLPNVDNRDLPMYDRFVKSVVVPDYNMEELISYGPGGFQIRHQVAPKKNMNLSQLQIEFKLNEDLRNYLSLFIWMRDTKYAQRVDTERFRDFTIKAINIEIMDNQKRLVAVLTFTKCFLLSLSSMSLENGTSDEVTFTTNFSYEEINYQLKSITS